MDMHPTFTQMYIYILHSPDSIIYCINLSKRMIYVPIEQTGVKFKPSRDFIVFRNAPIVVFIENGRFCCRERLFIFTKTNGLNLLNVCFI